jgi:hypothetical protein
VRWAIGTGTSVVLLGLLWAGYLRLPSARADADLNKVQAEWKSLEKALNETLAISKKAQELERIVLPLQQHATNRFLWALPLDALQHATVDDIQVVSLKMEQTLVQVEGVKAATKRPAQPAQTKEQITLTITAKNFADNEAEEAEDQFIERIATLPYFKNSLRKKEPVVLKQRLPQQVDSLDTTKTFTLFTIECSYPDRILGHE